MSATDDVKATYEGDMNGLKYEIDVYVRSFPDECHRSCAAVYQLPRDKKSPVHTAFKLEFLPRSHHTIENALEHADTCLKIMGFKVKAPKAIGFFTYEEAAKAAHALNVQFETDGDLRGKFRIEAPQYPMIPSGTWSLHAFPLWEHGWELPNQTIDGVLRPVTMRKYVRSRS